MHFKDNYYCATASITYYKVGYYSVLKKKCTSSEQNGRFETNETIFHQIKKL